MRLYLIFLLQAILGVIAVAEPPPPNAPKDKPVSATDKTLSEFEKAIAPYVAAGRKSYPEARKRYLEGLPSKHLFFVTIKLSDPKGKFEIVFLAVQKIDVKENLISGQLASDVLLVEGYRSGQALTLPESQILDWLISRPDGAEEGNVLGKFLDEYQKKKG